MADKFLEKVKRTADAYNMLTGARKVLAAVSGGPDSVAMLHGLCGLAKVYGFTVAVAHVNHGFRPESAEEAVFVREMAAGLGLDFRFTEARLGERLAGLPVNHQDEARKVRYAFLERTADEVGADRIAVGHNADDQAETWLMRVLRGSGSRGLSSIPPVRGRIIRPLIDTPREEIMEYLDRTGAGFVTDKSNLKPDYLRNHIRMDIMPLIRGCNPEAVCAMTRSAEILRQEDLLLDTLAGEALARISTYKAGALRIGTDGFTSLHEALRRRIIRLAYKTVKGDTLGLSYGHVVEAARLLTGSDTSGGADLPGGVRAERSYGEVIFRLSEPPSEGFSYSLPVPGAAGLPGGILTAEYADETPEKPDRQEAFINIDRLKGPLTVRSREDGDIFQPAGMAGRKKLTDFFIDLKVPRRERDNIPIVLCGGDIVWVAGFRADGRFAAGPGPARAVRLTYNIK
jgi:tRNA(Ile)-lysidine synthase